MKNNETCFSTISGVASRKVMFRYSSLAPSARNTGAFLFPSISQNQRSIAWQAFPEGAWFSHEGSMNSAGVLVSKYGADVSHTRVGLYGEMGHDVREKTGEGSRLDLARGGIQQKRADLAQAWLCVPGEVHSGGRFSRGSTPQTTAPPSSRASNRDTCCRGPFLPPRMVPSLALAVIRPFTSGNPVSSGTRSCCPSYGCQDGGILSCSSTSQSTLPKRVARFPVQIRTGNQFSRQQNSAPCGESLPAPILAKHFHE